VRVLAPLRVEPRNLDHRRLVRVRQRLDRSRDFLNRQGGAAGFDQCACKRAHACRRGLADNLDRPDVFGSGGNDAVTGRNFDDNLWGGAGNDTLNGGNGNDLPFGDVGVESLSGGPGNDTVYADSADT
jgi:Ca2+-binding RTX toxin-like protein